MQYLEGTKIIAAEIINLEKDSNEYKINPFDYSNLERKALSELGHNIEMFYRREKIKPELYRETKEHQEYINSQHELVLVEKKRCLLPGKFPLPLFFCTKFGPFIYSTCYEYKVAFSDSEEFSLAFGLLSRNLRTSEFEKLFVRFRNKHLDKFIAFLINHMLDYHFLYEETKHPEFVSTWIKGLDENIKPEKSQNSNKSKAVASKAESSNTSFIISEIKIDEEIVDRLAVILSKHFDKGQHENLASALKGKKIDSKLVFMGRSNQLAYVFSRLKDKNKIADTGVYIRKWICANFQYLGNSRDSKNFNLESVRKVFNGTQEVTRKKQIDISELLK